MYVCMYVCMCIYVYMYVCMYVCMYVYMYVCIMEVGLIYCMCLCMISYTVNKLYVIAIYILYLYVSMYVCMMYVWNLAGWSSTCFAERQSSLWDCSPRQETASPPCQTCSPTYIHTYIHTPHKKRNLHLLCLLIHSYIDT